MDDQKGGEKPQFDKEEQLTALWVKSDGSLLLCNYTLHFYKLREEFFAIGSPSTFMMGALFAGASAEEAVRLAILHTDGAGGEVQVERLEQPETLVASESIIARVDRLGLTEEDARALRNYLASPIHGSLCNDSHPRDNRGNIIGRPPTEDEWKVLRQPAAPNENRPRCELAWARPEE